jgi:hypothetical protein
MLAFVGAEVPELVPADGAAEGSAVLLVGEGGNRVDNGVRGVEGVVAEVAEEGTVDVVGAGLGLDVYIDAGGAAESGVEAVGDDLELADGVGGEAGLAEAGVGGVLGDLEAVEIDLELTGVVSAQRGIVRDRIDAVTSSGVMFPATVEEVVSIATESLRTMTS